MKQYNYKIEWTKRKEEEEEERKRKFIIIINLQGGVHILIKRVFC